MAQEQWLKALDSLKLAEEGFNQSAHFEDEKKQILFFLRGMMHEKLGDPTQALEYYRKANEFPDLPNANVANKLAEFEANLEETACSQSTRPSDSEENPED